MTGCTTCGGFGMHHDPIAHGTEPTEDVRVVHRYDAETCRCACGALDHPELGWVISA